MSDGTMFAPLAQYSSRDFADMARKITNLREVASMRERKLQDITALSKQVAEEKELLDRRKRSLDSVTLKLKAQKQKLERDARNARTSIRQLSQKEKTASSAKYRRSSSSTWPSANCAN